MMLSWTVVTMLLLRVVTMLSLRVVASGFISQSVAEPPRLLPIHFYRTWTNQEVQGLWFCTFVRTILTFSPIALVSLNITYSIILRQIVELTFGKTFHVVTLLSSSTILMKIDCNSSIITHSLRFTSNIVWVRFLFLTA